MGSINLLTINGTLWILWSGYWYVSAKSVEKTKSTESILMRLQHIIPSAIGFTAIFNGRSFDIGSLNNLVFNHTLRSLGVICTAVGLGFSVWARIHLGRYWSAMITLKVGHRLIRTGPYKLTRHPIYTGFLYASFGSALTSGTWLGLIGFIIIFITYVIKLKREEKLLIQVFGQEYVNFRKEVPGLIPFLF